MTVQNGSRIPEMRRGGDARRKLSINHPETTSTLAKLNIEEQYLAETARFGNAMFAAKRLWEMGKPNQLASHRITKGEAARLLRVQINALAKGGAE